MKKLLILLAFLILFFASPVFAGSYVISDNMTATVYHITPFTQKIIIDVDADGDGTIDNGDCSLPAGPSESLVSKMIGWHLLEVKILPESGGTGPTDASDIFIYDEYNQDLLGSEDCNASTGCTTPYRGLNAVDNTDVITLIPNLYQPGQATHQAYYPLCTGAWTIRIINNSANADINIVLKMYKDK